MREIHLAGHAINRYEDREILIDTHRPRLRGRVVAVRRRACERFGPTPTLIEWDTETAALDVLEDEACIAERCLSSDHAIAA